MLCVCVCVCVCEEGESDNSYYNCLWRRWLNIKGTPTCDGSVDLGLYVTPDSLVSFSKLLQEV